MQKIFFYIVAIATIYSCAPKKEIPLTPENALQKYLTNGDASYSWTQRETYNIEGEPVTAYDLVLTSQQWREFVWKHQLTILVPETVAHETALLFITGGSVKNGEPNFSGHKDALTKSMAVVARKNNAIISIIRQTPNQPLYDGKTEDELISFTLHNFKNDGDFTWPLLFPMVKSAVRAMDAIHEFSKKELG